MNSNKAGNGEARVLQKKTNLSNQKKKEREKDRQTRSANGEKDSLADRHEKKKGGQKCEMENGAGLAKGEKEVLCAGEKEGWIGGGGLHKKKGGRVFSRG